MEVFLLWLGLSFVAGFIAQSKGRSAIGFFFLSLILSPLIGIIFALLVAAHKKDGEEIPLRVGEDGRLEAIPTTKACPFCAETIKIEAVVCKHCARDLPTEQSEVAVG